MTRRRHAPHDAEAARFEAIRTAFPRGPMVVRPPDPGRSSRRAGAYRLCLDPDGPDLPGVGQPFAALLALGGEPRRLPLRVLGVGGTVMPVDRKLRWIVLAYGERHRLREAAGVV